MELLVLIISTSIAVTAMTGLFIIISIKDKK